MIRPFIEFAVKKPVLNHLILTFFVVMAIFAYQSIPKEVFPPAQRDKVVIKGNYAGASAEILDKMAVDALEQKVKALSDIQEVTSSIQNGYFTITANIKSGGDKLIVLSDVKDVITSIKNDLPADMDEPTVQVLEQAIPLVQVAVSGDIPLKTLIDHAEAIKDKIARIQELSKVVLYGKSETELVIDIDDKKVSAYGLDMERTVQALSSMASIFPIGKIEQQGNHLFLSTINGEKSAEAFEKMILKIGSKKVRLQDIARVRFALADRSELSSFNGKPNISINIQKSKEGNALALVKQIRKIVGAYHDKHPQLNLDLYSDTSVYIKNRLNTVISNILFGVILLFTALFMTVNRGIALVIAMGIPVSFIVALVSANLLGYSLNMLSLLGALLALGMLVDEAIVVAENIYRHLEMGKERMDAVIDGSVEMFPSVLAATMTTIFAFLPLLLMSGDMGVFMRILPVMISILLLSSLIEAFYFLPLHSKDFIHVRPEGARSHAFWDGLKARYRKTLTYLFHYKKRALALLVAGIFLLTVILGGMTRFQLFPDFDVTQMYVSGKVNINNSLEDSQKYVSRIEKTLLEKFDKENEVEHVTTIVGLRMNAKNELETGSNLFHIFIDLYEKKPENFFDTFINPLLSPEYDDAKMKRERLAKDIVKQVKIWLKPLQDESDLSGKKIFEEFEVVAPGAGVVAHDLEISLGGLEDAELVKGVAILRNALESMDHVYNVSDDAALGAAEIKLRVNAYGQSLGFTEQSVSNALRALYLKSEYSKMFDDEGIVSIKIESERKNLAAGLKKYELALPGTSQKIALSEVCDFIYQKSFARIKKDDGERLRTVYGSFEKDKIASAQIMQALEPAFEKVQKMGMHVVIKGEEKENRKVQRELGIIALIAIFLIFVTLVWMFDSLFLSLIVLSTIPLSVLGVFIGHLIMGLNLTMPGLMGIVGLAGVVVNDGIIMVDFIRRGKNLDEVISWAILRIRPIMLTSVTTILGLSTLIFFASGQALILQPMAVSLGFGVAWATVLNLLYVPLLYVVVKRIRFVS